MQKIINKPFVLIKRTSSVDPNNKYKQDEIFGQYDNKQESIDAYYQCKESFEDKIWINYYLIDVTDFINKDIDTFNWFNQTIDLWPGDDE